MKHAIVFLLAAALCSCASSATSVEEVNPFADAEPVEGGLYSSPAEEPLTITWGPWEALSDEWASSLAGWSITTRAIGRWTVRDWNRIFGPAD